jgi:hypothetical protein
MKVPRTYEGLKTALLGTPTCRSEDNIKMNLKGIGCAVMDSMFCSLIETS